MPADRVMNPFPVSGTGADLPPAAVLGSPAPLLPAILPRDGGAGADWLVVSRCLNRLDLPPFVSLTHP